MTPEARRLALLHQFARARHFRRQIDEGEVSTASEAAREAGLTSTRVYQLLGLLRLDPAIIAAMEEPAADCRVPTEKDLYRLSQLPRLSQQEGFRALRSNES